MSKSDLMNRLKNLEVVSDQRTFLFADLTETGCFIDDDTGKVYGTVNELVAAKGLDLERTIVISWKH